MEIRLTSVQKRLVGIARAKGKITYNDLVCAYSDPKSRRNAISRLATARIIKPTENFGEYIYSAENDSQTIQLLLSD